MSDASIDSEVKYFLDPQEYVSGNRAYLKSPASKALRSCVRSSLYYGFLMLVTSCEVIFAGSQVGYALVAALATFGGLVGGFFLPRRVALRTAARAANQLVGQEFVFLIGPEGWTHVRPSGVTTFVPWKSTAMVFQNAEAWVIRFEEKDLFLPRKPFRDAGQEKALTEKLSVETQQPQPA